MNTIEYNELLNRASRLDPISLTKFLEDLTYVARNVTQQPPQHTRNIMELEGLGQEIWQGLDAQAYVNRERDSWSG
jgi:hypothetical protein